MTLPSLRGSQALAATRFPSTPLLNKRVPLSHLPCSSLSLSFPSVKVVRIAQRRCSLDHRLVRLVLVSVLLLSLGLTDQPPIWTRFAFSVVRLAMPAPRPWHGVRHSSAACSLSCPHQFPRHLLWQSHNVTRSLKSRLACYRSQTWTGCDDLSSIQPCGCGFNTDFPCLGVM